MPDATATPQEPAATTEPDGPKDDQQAPATGDDLGDSGKKALEAERTRAKEAEKRAKQFERELEQVRTANLSEAERAVAEAEKRGEAAAAGKFGQRLAWSSFVAEAARRNPEWDAAAVKEDLNLARFVSEDGEPDAAEIAKAVERLVPASGGRVPSFDGGARSTAPASAGMNGLIRSGIRR